MFRDSGTDHPTAATPWILQLESLRVGSKLERWFAAGSFHRNHRRWPFDQSTARTRSGWGL